MRLFRTVSTIVLLSILCLSLIPIRAQANAPTPYEYALMSAAAYHDGLDVINNQWWPLLTSESGGANDQEGYFGVAYVNDIVHHIVIAHRGTDQAFFDLDHLGNADLMDDDINIAVSQLPIQFAASTTPFIDRVRAERDRIATQTGTAYTISHTGHSLGATLAELGSALMACVYHEAAPAVTFDSPGMGDMTATNTWCDDPVSLDVTTYILTPNAVNTATPHIGRIIALGTDWRSVRAQPAYNDIAVIGQTLLRSDNLVIQGVASLWHSMGVWVMNSLAAVIPQTWDNLRFLPGFWVRYAIYSLDTHDLGKMVDALNNNAPTEDVTHLWQNGWEGGARYFAEGWAFTLPAFDLTPVPPTTAPLDPTPVPPTIAPTMLPDVPTPVPAMPSGSTSVGLAFIWQGDVHYDFNFDPNGLNAPNGVNLSNSPQQDEGFFVWSPDGTRLVAGGATQNPPYLLTVDAGGSVAQRQDIVDATSGIYPPGWSPDGSRLAFISAGDAHLYVLEGGSARRWQSSTSADLPFYGLWAPQWIDGDRLLILRDDQSSGRVAGTGEIVNVRQNNSAPANFSLGERDVFLISPDHTRVLVLRYVDGENAGMAAMPLDPNSGSTVILTGDAPRPISNPAWSPDSSRVAYASNAPDNSSGQLYVASLDGQQIAAPHPPMREVETPMWLPDGRNLIFRGIPADTQSLGKNIYLLNLDTQALTVLAQNIGEGWGAVPTPFALDDCGEWLAYSQTVMTMGGAFQTELRVHNLITGQETVVVVNDGETGATNLAWRPQPACHP